MKTVLLFFVLLLCSLCIAQEKEDVEFKNEVLKLIEITGVKSQLSLVKNQFIKNVPSAKKAVFEKQFEIYLKEVFDNYAKNYMKLYTKEDIMDMITFYESPVGKKMQANSEEMSLRSKANAQEWMKKLQELVSKLQLPE